MSKGRDYSINILNKRDHGGWINNLTFSETVKIIESTLFSDISKLDVIDNKTGKLYDRMEFLELIK